MQLQMLPRLTHWLKKEHQILVGSSSNPITISTSPNLKISTESTTPMPHWSTMLFQLTSLLKIIKKAVAKMATVMNLLPASLLKEPTRSKNVLVSIYLERVTRRTQIGLLSLVHVSKSHWRKTFLLSPLENGLKTIPHLSNLPRLSFWLLVKGKVLTMLPTIFWDLSKAMGTRITDTLRKSPLPRMRKKSKKKRKL